MKRRLTLLLCFVTLLLSLAAAAAQVAPQPRGHSHNDYYRDRPLLDALDNGLCSVEADIFLVDGALLVGHGRKELRPEKNLQDLYLNPLRERALANGGRVFPGGPSILLLVDIKDDGRTTYARLREVLLQYKDILTEFTNDSTKEGAVTVVISGSSPQDMILAESPRYAAVDGRIPDLETNPSPHQRPLVSASWSSQFKWNGAGAMPEDELAQLRDYVAKANANGQRLRFWGLPMSINAWHVAYDNGVHLINVDFPEKLRKFLEEKQAG